MVTQELLDYIKRQQGNKVAEESIRSILLANGWLSTDVEKAFSTIKVRAEDTGPIVRARDLRAKIEASRPKEMTEPYHPPAVNSPFVSNAQQSDPFLIKPEPLKKLSNTEVEPLTNPLVSQKETDFYREPIGNETTLPLTPPEIKNTKESMLTDDMKDRLRTISNSSQSFVAPTQQEKIVPPVETPIQPSVVPTVNNQSYETPIKQQETQVVMPSESPIHDALIEQKKLEEIKTPDAPLDRSAFEVSSLPPLQNSQAQAKSSFPAKDRLYGNFSTGEYNPTMGSSYVDNEPHHPSHILKRVVLLLIFLGFIGGGIYIYRIRPDLITTFTDRVVAMLGGVSQPEVKEPVGVETPAPPVQSEPDSNQIQVTPHSQPTPPAGTLSSSLELDLKTIAGKSSAYISAKGTLKGLCNNVSSGIARDILALRSRHGSQVSCIDSSTSFAISAPFIGNGHLCIDSNLELILIKSPTKTAECVQ